MKLISRILFTLFIQALFFGNGYSQSYENLQKPEQSGIWIYPAQGEPAQPIWGFADGIQVGLYPMPGPRGLIRIYAPYLGHKYGEMINYIAIEPIPKGDEHRGLSELEMSTIDGVRGKRFWSANDTLCYGQLPDTLPAQGVIELVDNEETLTVFVFSEPFNNGAKVFLRLRFYAHRPYEVEFTTFCRKDSEILDYVILTATMGNFARLRTLYLESTTKSSLDLWPEYNDINFTDHDCTHISEMIKDKNGVPYFICSPNEIDVQEVSYAPNTNTHWKYYGAKATQYWYCPTPSSKLEGLVNGRLVYWASKSPIPGGISFENFELKNPFINGAKFVFGVSPLSPEEFISIIR